MTINVLVLRGKSSFHYKSSKSGVLREYSEITFREWTNFGRTPEIHVRSHYKF